MNNEYEQQSTQPTSTEDGISAVNDNAAVDAAKETGNAENGTKRRKKDDIKPLPFKTVAEYQRYMRGEDPEHTPDNDTSVRRNPPPEDGMTLADLGKKSDAEILGIINKMGSVPKKSDIRIMYIHGYSFLWTELTTVAAFKNFKVDNPGEQCPHYSLEGVTEQKPSVVIGEEEKEDGIIYIDHGRFPTKEVHWKLAQCTVDKFNDLLADGEYDNMELQKIRDAVIRRSVEQMLEYKRDRCFGVAYTRPKETEWVRKPD